MSYEIFGIVRVFLLLLIIAVFVVMCDDEQDDKTDSADLHQPTIVCAEEIEREFAEPVENWQSLGTFELTAYCPCEICCGIWATSRPADENGNPIIYTASGAIAQTGTTIAVDPSVIPYGSEVKINDHTYIAQDTGGAITGNRIDIYFDDHQTALEFGRQRAEVFVKADQ